MVKHQTFSENLKKSISSVEVEFAKLPQSQDQKEPDKKSFPISSLQSTNPLVLTGLSAAQKYKMRVRYQTKSKVMAEFSNWREFLTDAARKNFGDGFIRTILLFCRFKMEISSKIWKYHDY